jgi:hypothetical protein
MAIKRPKPEEIVVKLRQVEVLMGQGMPRIDAIRQISSRHALDRNLVDLAKLAQITFAYKAL